MERSVVMCEFCELTQTGTTTRYRKRYGFDQQLKTFKTHPSFIIAHDNVSLGFEGAHLLLLPREHHLSLLAVPKRYEVDSRLNDIFVILHRLYPQHTLFIFEHGSGLLNGIVVDCGGCHQDHAHLHILVLPTHVNVNKILRRIRRELRNLKAKQTTSEGQPFRSFSDLPNDPRPYLLLGSQVEYRVRSLEVWFQSNTSSIIPSQLVRKIISEVCKNPETQYWNWRDVELGFASDAFIKRLQQNAELFRSRINEYHQSYQAVPPQSNITELSFLLQSTHAQPQYGYAVSENRDLNNLVESLT